MKKIHCTNFIVFYEDTDSTGFSYHTSYLKFAERARSKMLIESFPDIVRKINLRSHFFVIREINVEYFKPALLFDNLILSTFLVKNKTASFYLQHNVLRDETLLCEIKVKLVWIDAESKLPLRLPSDLISRFKLMEVV